MGKKLIVTYHGEILDDTDNSWTYCNAICRIGLEDVYRLNIIYEKDAEEVPIVLGQSKKFPAGFTGTVIHPQDIYRIVYIVSDENRLRFLLEIKRRLNLSDEVFTAELV